MNVLGESARRWRTSRKRGVSPIIATILLVAITVVLAAVLYVLVSGLTKSGASTPYTLGMQSTGGATGSGNAYYDPLALVPTSGLTTSMVGLSISAAGGSTYGVGAVAGSGCVATDTYATGATGCAGPAAAGWYGVLVSSSNTILATYSSATGGWTYATGVTTIPLSSGDSLVIVSYNQLSGNDYTISAFSTGSSSVSGSATL
jgi:archaeal type IV pilus assembly protein PilA